MIPVEQMLLKRNGATIFTQKNNRKVKIRDCRLYQVDCCNAEIFLSNLQISLIKLLKYIIVTFSFWKTSKLTTNLIRVPTLLNQHS